MKTAEVEVDIELEDVIDYIMYDASDSEIDEIKEKIYHSEKSDFPIENLYDREKVLILKEAMKRYNLNELIEKLGITQADAL